MIDADLGAACVGLLAKLLTAEPRDRHRDRGRGLVAAVTRRITEWLADQRWAVEAEVHHGGQPLYPYLFGIE